MKILNILLIFFVIVSTVEAQQINFQNLYNDAVSRLVSIDDEKLFFEANANFTIKNDKVLILNDKEVKKMSKSNKFTLVKMFPIVQENSIFFVTFIFYEISYKKKLNYALIGNIKLYYHFDCESKLWNFISKKANFI